MAAESVLKQILDEIRDQVVALDLPGIAASNVMLMQMPGILKRDLPAIRFPAVVIAPYGAETVTAGSNVRDDVRYPVLVALCDTLAQSGEQPIDRQTYGFDQRMLWREAVRKAFSNQRLTSSLVMAIAVEPLAIVDPIAWQQGLFVSGLLLRCTSREGRT